MSFEGSSFHRRDGEANYTHVPAVDAYRAEVRSCVIPIWSHT